MHIHKTDNMATRWWKLDILKIHELFTFICLRMCYNSLNCIYCTVFHVTYMLFSYTQHVLDCRAHYAYFPSISFIHPFCPIVVAAMSQFPTVLSSSTDQCVSQRASANIMMDWSKLTLDLEMLWKYSNLLRRQHPWASLPQTHRHPRGPPPKWPQPLNHCDGRWLVLLLLTWGGVHTEKHTSTHINVHANTVLHENVLYRNE